VVESGTTIMPGETFGPPPELTLVQVLKDADAGVDGLGGAGSVTVSPDGEHVYVAGVFGNEVGVFSRDAASGSPTFGELSFIQVLKDGVGGVDGLAAAGSVTVSPDGEHVYVAGETDDAVAVFSRDAASGSPDFGKLTFIQILKDGDFDGVNTIDGLDQAFSVTVSPDGEHVYAAGSAANAGGPGAVVVFSRDAASGSPTFGELTFVEVLKDDVGGVDGLRFATSVTVSPDGEHVYAAGSGDDAVAVFSRDAASGSPLSA
jgi:DNA-binding beta-propeller fold protein YncE